MNTFQFKKNNIVVESSTLQCEYKGKCCSHALHEGTWWSGGTSLIILNLNTRWRWAVTFTLTYYVESTPQYPLKSRHGGPQTWIGYFAKEQNLLPCWKMTHNCLAVQSAAWQLHCLNCPECNWALPLQFVVLFHIWCWQPLLLMKQSAAKSNFQTSGNRGLLYSC